MRSSTPEREIQAATSDRQVNEKHFAKDVISMTPVGQEKGLKILAPTSPQALFSGMWVSKGEGHTTVNTFSSDRVITPRHTSPSHA